jgi:hypothetical protein
MMMTRISWRSCRAYDILTTLKRSHVIIHVSFFNVLQELYGPTKIKLSFRKKARTIGEVQGQFGGIWKCTPSLWSLLSSSDKNLSHLDTTTALNWAISKNFEIRVIKGTGEWFEIDQVTDLDAT